MILVDKDRVSPLKQTSHVHYNRGPLAHRIIYHLVEYAIANHMQICKITINYVSLLKFTNNSISLVKCLITSYLYCDINNQS